MKKYILPLMCLSFLPYTAIAEELTVTHTTTGDFENELAAALSEKGLTAQDVTSLKIVGEANMSAEDFIPVRAQLKETLKSIDLSETVFKNNTLPSADQYGKGGALNQMIVLEEVKLPETLENIQGGTFYGCKELRTVNSPSALKELGMNVFGECTNLTSFKLPRNLTTIPGGLFSKCTNLVMTDGDLPDGVEVIETNAFQGCKQVTFSIIPATLTKIRDSGFASSGVTFSEWTENLVNLEASAFSGSKVTFTTWSPYIESMPVNVFGYCTTITDFTIPENITSLPKRAFMHNSWPYTVRTFTCRNTTPPTAVYDKGWENTFYEDGGDFKKTTFKVKYEALEAYQNTLPYSKMTIVPLTTNINVTVAGEGAVSSELGELTDGVMPIYEGNSTITFTPAEGYDVVSVKYGETELIENVVDNTLVFDCPQNPETLSVEFSISSSVNALESAQVKVYPNPTTDILHIENNEGTATLYDLAGQKVASTDSDIINVSDLNAGVYILKTKEASFKVVKR